MPSSELFGASRPIERRAHVGDVLPQRDDVRDLVTTDAHGDLRNAEGARLTEGVALHLELLQPPGREHLVELGPDPVGRLP